ncbi:MAG: penicillin-binding protein 2 [Actinomycetota bacterium]|nr:penicillin-binding protein 2 [Actinomycetota bacterium]
MASRGTRANGRFLPPDPRVEEPFRLTPQLAFRIAILGAVALAIFGILFFRLWALQILAGPQYLKAALNNQVRTMAVEAPRGPIVDRNGRVLVQNVPGTAVQLWPADLPKTWPARRHLLRRLSRIIHVPVRPMLVGLNRRAGDPVTPVTVKEAVPEDQVSYLKERKAEFPGVQIAQAYLRNYPYGATASHLLGYVGEISSAQLRSLKAKGYRIGDKIGQGGIESSFDQYLRGRAGVSQRHFDSLGRPLGVNEEQQKAFAGQAVRLTLDVGLQRAAEDALRYGIQLGRSSNCVGCWASNGGALVAMDPRDGSILAMASNPTYDPSVYVGRADKRKLAPLLAPEAAKKANSPGVNRATSGLYPAGSTFKPVTALAALQEGVISPYDSLPCTGSITIAKQKFSNWDPNVSELMNMSTALGASCDTFFYQLGHEFYKLPPERGHPLQAWAQRMGIGVKTGIDVGPEAKGLLPTPEWRKATYTRKTDKCCWEVDRLWKPGDSIQLAIGQKDLQVTPLQMTRFYAMVANGGTVVRPHLFADVEQPGNKRTPGRVLHTYTPPPQSKVRLDPNALAVVRDGLYQATHADYGTSSSIFGSFPIPVVGKTGTAEKVVQLPTFKGLIDQSWWCGYGPYDKPEIVVCALIENAGHGSSAAAPAALRVFEHYFKAKAPQASVGHGD